MISPYLSYGRQPTATNPFASLTSYAPPTQQPVTWQPTQPFRSSGDPSGGTNLAGAWGSQGTSGLQPWQIADRAADQARYAQQAQRGPAMLGGATSSMQYMQQQAQKFGYKKWLMPGQKPAQYMPPRPQNIYQPTPGLIGATANGG